MKYIRTKDGRILKDIDCENFSIEDYSNYMNDVYKQADTIEELCDEFYLQWDKNVFPYSTYRQHERYAGWGDLVREIRSKENYGNYLNKNFKVYGAIWIDKGLIFVACMNSEGELCLL